MKKIVLGLGLIAITSSGFSQNGLDSIIVEKYYVATAADSIASDGILRVGSVTYRVYADLAAGYEFQAMYGELIPGDVNNTPLHTLKVSTSTTFFNNEDRGSTKANSINKQYLNDNSVALDSYFSVGAAAADQMGVLKSEDDGVLNTIHPHSDGAGVLSNTVAAIGIPLTTQDGMITGTPEAVTFVGLNGEENIFDASSEAGSSFQISNASIASLNGSVGPTSTNRVLLGQFTTTGTFHFELNLQIALVSGGGVQKWVASNPEPGEYTHASLTYTSPTTGGGGNSAPSVSLTQPLANASYNEGSTVSINAIASDLEGYVDFVDFYIDGNKILSDNSSPYTATWVSTVGTHTVLAKATDDEGAEASSLPVIINVNAVSGINNINVIDVASAITVYPVPAENELNLSINLANQGVVEYTIYDQIGRAIISKQLGSLASTYSEKINISALTNGIYFIRIYVDGEAVTKKFIKQ